MSLVSFFKKFVVAIVIGVVLGAIIGYVLATATEEQFAVLLPVFVIIIAAAFVVFCTIVILRYVKFSKEGNRLLKILYEDIDVDKYIKETETAIAHAKDRVYRLNFSLNLAVGYSAKGDYQKAVELMKAINISHANTMYKALYYNNLASFYLETNHFQEANNAYSDGALYINRFSKNPLLSSTFLSTKAVIEYSKGNLTLSEELLEKVKQQGKTSSHFRASADIYLVKIYMRTGRLQKAKVLLDYNMAQKLLPNITDQTKMLLEEIKNAEA